MIYGIVSIVENVYNSFVLYICTIESFLNIIQWNVQIIDPQSVLREAQVSGNPFPVPTVNVYFRPFTHPPSRLDTLREPRSECERVVLSNAFMMFFPTLLSDIMQHGR